MTTRATMGIVAALGLLCVAVGGSAASAQETLRINGSFNQEFRFDDGGLRGGRQEGDPTYSSRTSLGLRFEVREPRLTASLSPGVSALLSNDGEFDTRDLLPRFNGVARYNADRGLSLTANASVTPRFVEESQFDDTGVSRADILQLDSQLRFGLSQQLDPRHSLTASVNGRLRTFTEETQNLRETRSFGLSAGVNRRKSPTTSAGLSLSGRFFDNGGGTEGVNVSASVNGSHTVNPALSLSGSIGPSLLLRSTERGGGDTALGVDFNGSVGYSINNATSLSLGASQNFDQRSDGVLENRAALNASVSHRLSRRASLSVTGNIGLQNPAFAEEIDDRRTFSLSPSLRYVLSPDWTLNASYRLRVRDDEDDTRLSNGFSIQLSRGLLILP